MIEIKFRRNQGENDNDFLKAIKNDYEKLKELLQENNVTNFYSFMVFDKKQDMRQNLELKKRLSEFCNKNNNIDFTYKFATSTINTNN